MKRTKTKSNMAVTLKAKLDQMGSPCVRASFSHPQVGDIEMDGAWVDQKNAMVGRAKGQMIGLAIPKEDYEAVLEEAQGIIRKRREEVLNDEVPMRIDWQKGSPLSGYTVYDDAQLEALKRHGVVDEVSGWGEKVQNHIVKALGTEFLYSELVAYMKPREDAKIAEQEERQRKSVKYREEKRQEAAKTGSPVLLDSYTTACDDDREECSTDIVSRYITAGGKIETKRSHTH